MSGSTSKRYPAELRERAVRMVAEVRAEHESEWAAMSRVAELLGVGTPETVRKWCRQAQVDAGQVDQVRGEPEPLCRVVVAAGEHDLGARVDESGHRLGEQLDSLGGQLVWRVGKHEANDEIVVRLGYASAISYIFFFLIILISIAYMVISSRRSVKA